MLCPNCLSDMNSLPTKPWTSLFVCPECFIAVERHHQDMMGGGKIEYIDKVFTKLEGELLFQIEHTLLAKKLKLIIEIGTAND